MKNIKVENNVITINKSNVKQCKIDHLQWFDKTYGNTYRSIYFALYFKDGSKKTLYDKLSYGYGDINNELTSFFDNMSISEIRELLKSINCLSESQQVKKKDIKIIDQKMIDSNNIDLHNKKIIFK